MSRPVMETISPRSRVLIVDDDVDTLETLSEVLQLGGVQVVARARSVAEAEQVLAQGFAASAIVLDLCLDRERGESLIAHLKEHPSLEAVPVIALSGDHHALAAVRERVARVLLKPASPDELVHALADLDRPAAPRR